MLFYLIVIPVPGLLYYSSFLQIRLGVFCLKSDLHALVELFNVSLFYSLFCTN